MLGFYVFCYDTPMKQQKTQPTKQDVATYISKIDLANKKHDAEQLLEIFGSCTSEKPVLWGPSMIGYGSYHYKYASGHEGDSFKVGFSPRKTTFVLYGLTHPSTEDKIKELGKIKRGVGCIYIKKLSDINIETLEEIIREAYCAI